MPEQQYDHRAIEAKWQPVWDGEPDLYRATEDDPRPKYYVVEMLPYPSGKLHMGHVRNYSIGDTLARYMWMRGYNVLHPMGWDAFGLPAENAAIKSGKPPREWTVSNIATMKGQLKRLGFSYDWDREIATCTPAYYHWNQWFFLKMYDRGLAYRKKSRVNWCPQCATVLANEQVVNGCCWRHETTPVEQREIEQWFLKITDYADELVDGLVALDPGWPERVRAMQSNWIGRSDGAEVDFPLEIGDEPVRVFTTRIDTICGATCVILAPDHPVARRLTSREQAHLLDAMSADQARKEPGDLEKEGFFTGAYATNPFSGDRVPVWVGNFVLMQYGTGAIMAVPAHDERDFEFCTKYKIPIHAVIRPVDGVLPDPVREAFTGYGVVEKSGTFSGMPSEEARQKMASYAKFQGFGESKVTYRLRDWGISRQRYWGTPIPMVHCPRCGVVAVREPDLPVILPEQVNLTGEGRSPLDNVPEFVNVECPQCGGAARRETDTMDTFVDSSWYFYRYCDPHNDKQPFDPAIVNQWFPMNQYIGGITHAILHLLYSRFWTKVMRDIGLVANSEPAANLFTQGMVLGFDGTAMSKSKGNVVDPDLMVEKYGADTCRLFTLFAAPPDKDMEWNESSVEGQHRFLGRIFRFVTRNIESDRAGDDEAGREALRKLHQTIRKITLDFENRWHFNTSIAALMELSNDLAVLEPRIPGDVMPGVLDGTVKLLAPFAPYTAQELWSLMGGVGHVLREPWPLFDESLAAEDVIEIPVQVNGKVRGRLLVAPGSNREDLERAALADEKVKSHLADRQVTKIVVLQDRLINIVAR